MVTTHSEEEHRLLVSLRNQGRADGGGWLDHARLGFNYRIDDIRAAIGIGQLEKLDRDPRGPERRRGALRRSCSRTSTGSACRVRTTRTTSARGSCTSSRSPPGTTAKPSSRSSTRVASRPPRYLPCIHLQPYMRERYGFAEGTVPGRRGRELAHARASVPHAHRGGRPGVRGRGPPGGTRVVRRGTPARARPSRFGPSSPRTCSPS